MLSVRKILQALYYLQSKAPSKNKNKYDIMYLLKLFYFSDRYHLRHFGSIASGDTYYAMKNGPVASGAFDILRGKIHPSVNWAEIPLINENIVPITEYEVQVKKQNDDKLSESFKQSLDFSLKIFGEYEPLKLSEISHIYPEWKKHEKSLKAGKKSIAMKTADFLDDPDCESLKKLKEQGLDEDPFNEPDKKFLELLRNDLNENAF